MKRMNRRNFLRHGAQAVAAGYALNLPLTAAEPGLRYGVQLYTLRKEAVADLPATLASMRKIGFTEVELNTIVYTHPAATLRRMVEDSGLSAQAGQFQPAEIEGKLDYARELGIKYMVSLLPKPRPVSLDDYKAFGAELNRLGTAVRAHGMELAFLSHSYEFMPQGGTTGFAEIMRTCDPAMLKLESDLYWIVQAGLDPAAYLHQYRNRIRILHLKDRLAAPPGFEPGAASEHSTEMGQGAMPWPALLTQARHQGIRYAYIDQDVMTMPIYESLAKSFHYLKSLKS